MNMDSSTVYARGVPDSAGVEKGTPVFKAVSYTHLAEIKGGIFNTTGSAQYVVDNEGHNGAANDLGQMTISGGTCLLYTSRSRSHNPRLQLAKCL